MKLLIILCIPINVNVFPENKKGKICGIGLAVSKEYPRKDESFSGSRALNGAAYLIVVFPNLLHIVPVVLLETPPEGFTACIIGG